MSRRPRSSSGTLTTATPSATALTSCPSTSKPPSSTTMSKLTAKRRRRAMNKRSTARCKSSPALCFPSALPRWSTCLRSRPSTMCSTSRATSNCATRRASMCGVPTSSTRSLSGCSAPCGTSTGLMVTSTLVPLPRSTPSLTSSTGKALTAPAATSSATPCADRKRWPPLTMSWRSALPSRAASTRSASISTNMPLGSPRPPNATSIAGGKAAPTTLLSPH